MQLLQLENEIGKINNHFVCLYYLLMLPVTRTWEPQCSMNLYECSSYLYESDIKLKRFFRKEVCCVKCAGYYQYTS